MATGPYMSLAAAAAHYGFPSANAFRMWCHRVNERARRTSRPLIRFHYLGRQCRIKPDEIDAHIHRRTA